jgi:hypothetical protein
MKVNIIATAATKKQVTNAKTLFGSKGESILTALESANKHSHLVTTSVHELLVFLKAADEAEVVKYANSVGGKKLIPAVKAFVTNKSFEGKLNALKAIKFKSPIARPQSMKDFKFRSPKSGSTSLEPKTKTTEKVNTSKTVSILEAWVEKNLDNGNDKLNTKFEQAFLKKFPNPEFYKVFSKNMGVNEEGAASFLVENAATSAKAYQNVHTFINDYIQTQK